MTTPIDTTTGPTALSKLPVPSSQERAHYAEDWFRIASGFLRRAVTIAIRDLPKLLLAGEYIERGDYRPREFTTTIREQTP